ncbi:type IV secretory pathway VirB10-like protein [Microvirga flocculans]|uniref:Type IV secretory pathway VirB10-like protein n=1 Tax=Microvirga flocculans TaxID=217168 RepID=A0A7W6IDU7_9HYPH|nr:type IV secretory pathway VirB10-like protein [Microvirga flocculans]
MAGSSGCRLLTATLLGALANPLAAYAQTGRPWVDPPPESTGPALGAPAPAPPQPSSSAQPTHRIPSSDVQAATDKERREPQPASDEAGRSVAADEQARPKTTAGSKVRSQAQQARTSSRAPRREDQAARRAGAGSQISQAQPRNAFDRRTRGVRYGSIQEGLDAGLEVMRMRTFQLPDGRRITVLTRPDQDPTPQFPDGY